MRSLEPRFEAWTGGTEADDVTETRRRADTGVPVESWEELLRVAGQPRYGHCLTYWEWLQPLHEMRVFAVRPTYGGYLDLDAEGWLVCDYTSWTDTVFTHTGVFPVSLPWGLSLRQEERFTGFIGEDTPAMAERRRTDRGDAPTHQARYDGGPVRLFLRVSSRSRD
jgi:hypothetical protein